MCFARCRLACQQLGTVLRSDARMRARARVCVCVCVLVKFRRRQSFWCFLFYDDGSLADQERREAFAQGQIVNADVLRCGFLLSDAEAIGIYELCMRHFICLEVEKIPRELNEKAY